MIMRVFWVAFATRIPESPDLSGEAVLSVGHILHEPDHHCVALDPEEC